jgi:glutamine---fructose-6-phosphate transaminase (isomerizing)
MASGGSEFPNETTRLIFAQPRWLRGIRTDLRLPPAARTVYTGCGTSFHAAQTGGEAVQALDLVADARSDIELLVLLSHEGETEVTLEAARLYGSVPKWLVTGVATSSLASLCEQVIVAAPEVETSWCHTASYTAAVAQLAALRGEDVSWLADAVEGVLSAPRLEPSDHERWLVAGAGHDLATAREAVLKLREGAHVAAEVHHTEELLHGELAAVDESVRCFVLQGSERIERRSEQAVAALSALGCDVMLVPTHHPVVDIVQFQLLTVDLAARRGVNPDVIRRDQEPWARARAAY